MKKAGINNALDCKKTIYPSRSNYEVCVVGIFGKRDSVMARCVYTDQDLAVFLLWVYVMNKINSLFYSLSRW